VSTVLTAGAFVYLALCLLMLTTQRSLQYRPDPRPMDPVRVGLVQAKAITVETSDSERIVLWWIEPRSPQHPVWLYLHGNGANLEARAARFNYLTRDGAGLLAVSWRGYGGSSGTPTERGLRHDARAAYDWLSHRVSPERVLLFGESLGTTLAVMLAADVPVRALVLDSSFSSVRDVASHAYPWLPVDLLLLDPLRADLAAPNVSVPVQQFHCTEDPVIPIEFAERLRALLPRAQPIIRHDARCHVPSVASFEPALTAFVRTVLATGR